LHRRTKFADGAWNDHQIAALRFVSAPYDLTYRSDGVDADMPVELATKFDLIINVATAKVLGVEIPPTIQALADEVSNEPARVHIAARPRGRSRRGRGLDLQNDGRIVAMPSAADDCASACV
jgi:hypothetical protein